MSAKRSVQSEARKHRNTVDYRACIRCGSFEIPKRSRLCKLCKAAEADQPPGADDRQEEELKLAKAMQGYEALRGNIHSFEAVVRRRARSDADRRNRREARKARRTVALEDAEGHEALAVPAPQRVVDAVLTLREVLAVLPHRAAAILTMHYLVGMKLSEIASSFLIPDRSVLTSIESSIHIIRECFPELADSSLFRECSEYSSATNDWKVLDTSRAFPYLIRRS